MKRETLSSDVGGGSYFSAPKSEIEFIPSGCRILDCVLGGGWPLGRIGNIIGDKSTGKTLLAIEACANFDKKFPKGKMYYREVEAAFDQGYAAALGMPVDKIDFGKEPLHTIEAVFDDMVAKLKVVAKAKAPALYILDSLDALSDEASLERDIREGSYNMTKQKLLGELFRRLVREIGDARMAILIISQVREKIGVTFGDKYSRSGGRALHFYATHELWLSHKKTLVRTISGVKRSTGVSIHAKCKKNKIGLPFRECEFDIMFGFGVDDLAASVDWLAEVGRLKEIGVGQSKEAQEKFLTTADKMSNSDYRKCVGRVAEVAERVWREVDDRFLPSRKKYEDD